MDPLYLLRRLHGLCWKIIHKYSLWKQKNRWDKDAEELRNQMAHTPQVELDMGESFLILMPHSDDEWIGCSQIIKKGSKVTICNMNMQGGDTDEVHKMRYIEAKNVADIFSRELISLSSHNREKELADVINQYCPDFILLPYFFDWHPEHNDVMKTCYRALDACDYKGRFLLYQVSVPIPAQDCNCCIAMNSDERNEKWNIFMQYYKTQSFMPTNRFKAYERINGVMIESYAAETYYLLDINGWKEGIENKLLDDNEKNILKTNLNDIVFMTQEVNRLYRKRQRKKL